MSKDFYEEISEDLRQQELKKFWQENGNWIIGGVILAIIMTAAMSFWRDYTLKQNQVATSALITAMDTQDPDKLEVFAGDGRENQAMLARFAEARLFIKRGQIDQAAAVYDSIAATRGVDKAWKQLAVLNSVAARFEKEDPGLLRDQLQPLQAAKAPWRFSAMELDALLYAREGKNDKAAALLGQIAIDPDAPPSLRQRALGLGSFYGGKASPSQKE